MGSSPDGIHLDRDGWWRNEGERRLTEDGPLWPRKELTTVSEERIQGSGFKVQGSDAPAPDAAAPAAPPTDHRISMDEFLKVELRVAKVLSAERVPKSTRLLKLLVDTGADQRTIVAGIAEAYDPESLVGRSVAIVFNLKPAKLMGIESNGMVLAASPESGKPLLVAFDEAPPPGTRIR
jgi:methionyl-tRNA synthetase